MLIFLLLMTTIILSYWNGANDNFKGVATLYGSGTLSYRSAITLATVTTFLGSISAMYIAQGLIASFSGKGLVPQEVAGTTIFLISTGLGAASTILLATRLGFPISTTHSLVGGLLGAGFISVGMEVNFSKLGSVYIIPLLVSPFIAFCLAFIVFRVVKSLRHYSRKTKSLNDIKANISKLSVDKTRDKRLTSDKVTLYSQASNSGALTGLLNCADEKNDFLLTNYSEALNLDLKNNKSELNIKTEDSNAKRVKASSLIKANFSSLSLMSMAHIFSAASVSFARGLNDTPKIAGLFVAVEMLNIQFGMLAIAIGMAIGGLLNARKVAETISHKITKINNELGFSANLVTSFLVIVASKFGIPVSTTHVSVGSIFGASMLTGERNHRMINSILLSWVITLPSAMLFSGVIYWLLS